MKRHTPRVIIIAGPAGAGKTTFAREFLPIDAACPVFVNRELIAAGLAPFTVEAAPGHVDAVMQSELERHFAARGSFAFESTLADARHVRAIAQWRAAGYRVKVIYLQLDSPELAFARLAQRDYPAPPTARIDAIENELDAGLELFAKHIAPNVDSWACYDNSGVQPMLLGWRESASKHAFTTTNAPIDYARDRDLRASFVSIRRAAQRVHEMAALTGTSIAVARNGIIELLVPGAVPETISIHEPMPCYGP